MPILGLCPTRCTIRSPSRVPFRYSRPCGPILGLHRPEAVSQNWNIARQRFVIECSGLWLQPVRWSNATLPHPYAGGLSLVAQWGHSTRHRLPVRTPRPIVHIFACYIPPRASVLSAAAATNWSINKWLFVMCAIHSTAIKSNVSQSSPAFMPFNNRACASSLFLVLS